MRAFIGTGLSSTNLTAADEWAARLARASQGALRPIPPRSAHITHAFLGEIDQVLVRPIVADLEQLMAGRAAMPFVLGPPALLRPRREPRLVMAPVRAMDGEAVSRLSRALVRHLRRYPGLTDLPLPHAPHVTLLRVRRGGGLADIARLTALLESPHDGVVWQPDALAALQLMRSDLGPAGPRYTVVGEARCPVS